MGRRKFKFENAWLTKPMCSQLVRESWETMATDDIQSKIKNCGENLQQWGKDITGKFSTRIKNCIMEIMNLRNRIDANSAQRYKDLKSMLIRILEQREIFRRQRSKQLWLHLGDKNNKYFHATAYACRRTNRITRLKK